MQDDVLNLVYGFDVPVEFATPRRTVVDYGTAALLIYAIYRSRDRARFKISTDMWERIPRFAKASAKRSRTLPRFIELFQQAMSCPMIRPQSLLVAVGETKQAIPLAILLAQCNQQEVLKILYEETGMVIAMVRDRLNREKAIETTLVREIESDDSVIEVVGQAVLA